jgi:hypothetical protein
MESQRACRERPHVAARILQGARIVAVACLVSPVTGPVSGAAAADLRADTASAFERYVQLTEARGLLRTPTAAPLSHGT